ncbi:MAG: AraC family transcriptional regulator [Bacteroidales bacterium]|nr:AraC family transcriptional regulator [Bacteroidales bacterium]
MSDHALVFLSSGSLEISKQDRTLTMSPGESIFIRKDCAVTLTKSMGADGSPFKSVMIIFERKFLLQYFRKIRSEQVSAERSSSSVLMIPPRPDTASLFTSLMPFFWSEDKPTEEWVIGKKTEGLDCILKTDKNVYASLFDFSGKWKIDLADFMEKNYTQNLSLDEFANYTGRSLSSFNRDFRKIYGEHPQKWIINKRLEAAKKLLSEKPSRVQDIMNDVGFTNLSHFSRIYKETYGHSPSEEYSLSHLSLE